MDPRRLLPVLSAVACALVVATLVVGRGGPDDRDRDRAAASTSREAPTTRASPASAVRAPAAVLAAWDERRSAAWAHGDAGALADLYAPRSRSGAVDVRLLRAYARRGLRVEGLATQVLGLRVLERSSRRLVLVVTDRVVGGAAVGGPAPVALPADRASTRRVVLARQRGRWVVAEARDLRDRGGQGGQGGQDSAAASTSRTSSSSKS